MRVEKYFRNSSVNKCKKIDTANVSVFYVHSNMFTYKSIFNELSKLDQVFMTVITFS